MKNKYILYLLACAMLLYFAVPRIQLFASGLEGIFSISWLVFALFVVAGNVVGLLFSGKNQVDKPFHRGKQKAGRQQRSF